MKNNLVKIYVVILCVILAACLDDNKYALDPSGTKNVIEFYDNSVPTNPAGAVYPVWTNVTPLISDTTFVQTISYSGNGVPSEDIELTLAIDPLALEEYNAQRIEEDEKADGTYYLMPDSIFSFDDFTVTIPKGQTKVDITFSVSPLKFDLTKSYVLPLRIVSASSGTLSSQWSVGLMAVVVKNKYDGIYDILDGQVTRLVGGVQDAALGGQYNDDLVMALSTVNGNTCSVVPLWKDGSTVGGVAGTRFTFNEATNDVTVSATGNGTLANMPGTTRIYDPIAKTIEVSFTWSTPGTREIKNLKLEYNRSR